ncbi:MAG: hypothetical protein ACI379_15290 [Nocardioides sp.]|uniref:hypothetical protein n=1 Tax=Nocardioides sp. TaxID=35761 RepID=UPI003F011A58
MRKTRVCSLAVVALVAPLLALTPSAGAEPGAGVPGPVGDDVPFARTADEVVGQGEWRVEEIDGGYRVAWTSPTLLPMGGDRPTIELDGQEISGARLSEDGRTVEVDVLGGREPAEADLDVVLSGRALDEPLAGAVAQATPGFAPGSRVLADDPATPGPYEVVSSDYTLDPVAVPGANRKIEMVGHVEAPAPGAATGPRPLVLFLHGRHSVCYNPDDPDDFGGTRWPCRAPRKEIPSHLGYTYVQKVLASQGYTTVSIRVNGINAQDWQMADAGADARARIVRAHLDHWVTRASAEQVDLDQVVLVGHSRGGEGVNRATIQIPLDAPYRIAGQVLLAPTDFGYQTAPYVPTVTLLPSCDGDVYDLQGQRFTDVSRGLVAADTSLKSSVFVQGANHNYFNTEWTPGIAEAPAWDDWGDESTRQCGSKNPGRLTATEQQAAGTALIAGAVDVFSRGDERFLGLFDGEDVRVASTGDTATRSHALGGGRETLRPGKELTLAADPGRASLCRGIAFYYKSGCGKDVRNIAPHWVWPGEAAPAPRQGVAFGWTAAGQEGRLSLAAPLDLSDRDLELRTVVDQRYARAGLKVRLTDASGASALLTPVGGGMLPRVPRGLQGAWWAQTLTVDPSAAAVDLTQVTGITLVSTTATGGVVLLDASAAPDALAAVPDERAAQVSFGTVEVEEGDGPGQVSASVPVTVNGTLTSAAKVRVATFSDDRDVTWRTLTLAPGQTSATIDFTYTADNRYGFDRRFGVAGYVDQGVVTDGYVGELLVTEDDPKPTMTVKAVRGTVTEGQNIVVRVTLSEPMSVRGWFDAGFVKMAGPYLKVKDVKLPRQRGYRANAPLYRYRTYVLVKSLAAGQKSFDLVLPTKRDSVRERTEKVKFRVRMQDADGLVSRDVVVRVKNR